MAAKRLTLRDLANEADVDVDEALVTLWDQGYESIEDPDVPLPRREIPGVQRVLGVANAKEMRAVRYWQDHWNLDRAGLDAKLRREFGIAVSANARVLPKGALRRLRRVGADPAYAHVVPEQRTSAHEMNHPTAPAQWDPPGHARGVVPLTVEEICQIHEALVEDFAATGDPIDPPGARDDHLLRSAAARPETSLNGERKYTTVESHAAALLHSLILNHPFHNGNKRTGLVSLLVLLDRNNILLTCDEQQLFRQMLRVAQHGLVPKDLRDPSDPEVLAIAKWICENSRPIERGERVLKWNELRRILTSLGCDVGSPMPGNKLKISREVTERRLGLKRRRLLTVTAGYRNAGQDVDYATLTRIRKELGLDDAAGYDSAYFYGSDPREPDDFIAQYRTLLRRLARL